MSSFQLQYDDPGKPQLSSPPPWLRDKLTPPLTMRSSESPVSCHDDGEMGASPILDGSYQMKIETEFPANNSSPKMKHVEVFYRTSRSHSNSPHSSRSPSNTSIHSNRSSKERELSLNKDNKEGANGFKHEAHAVDDSPPVKLRSKVKVTHSPDKSATTTPDASPGKELLKLKDSFEMQFSPNKSDIAWLTRKFDEYSDDESSKHISMASSISVNEILENGLDQIETPIDDTFNIDNFPIFRSSLEKLNFESTPIREEFRIKPDLSSPNQFQLDMVPGRENESIPVEDLTTTKVEDENSVNEENLQDVENMKALRPDSLELLQSTPSTNGNAGHEDSSDGEPTPTNTLTRNKKLGQRSCSKGQRSDEVVQEYNSSHSNNEVNDDRNGMVAKSEMLSLQSATYLEKSQSSSNAQSPQTFDNKLPPRPPKPPRSSLGQSGANVPSNSKDEKKVASDLRSLPSSADYAAAASTVVADGSAVVFCSHQVAGMATNGKSSFSSPDISSGSDKSEDSPNGTATTAKVLVLPKQQSLSSNSGSEKSVGRDDGYSTMSSSDAQPDIMEKFTEANKQQNNNGGFLVPLVSKKEEVLTETRQEPSATSEPIRKDSNNQIEDALVDSGIFHVRRDSIGSITSNSSIESSSIGKVKDIKAYFECEAQKQRKLESINKTSQSCAQSAVASESRVPPAVPPKPPRRSMNVAQVPNQTHHQSIEQYPYQRDTLHDSNTPAENLPDLYIDEEVLNNAAFNSSDHNKSDSCLFRLRKRKQQHKRRHRSVPKPSLSCADIVDHDRQLAMHRTNSDPSLDVYAGLDKVHHHREQGEGHSNSSSSRCSPERQGAGCQGRVSDLEDLDNLSMKGNPRVSTSD